MQYLSLARCEERQCSLAEARRHVWEAPTVAVSVRLGARGKEALARISKAAAGRLIASAAKRGVKVILLAECFGWLVLGN